MRARHDHRIKQIKAKRKVKAWKNEVTHVGRKVINMVKKYYADPTSITLVDWDKFTKRNFGKLQAQCKKKYPREEWPPGVPYLNFIAYAKHTETCFPRSEWAKGVPYGNFKARKKYVARYCSRDIVREILFASELAERSILHELQGSR
jgi:hypothetical protein